MKMTKYLIALGGFCAVIIWATSSSCSSKQVSCNNDGTFATASAVLVAKCNRCHGDSITASKFGQNIMINGKDSVDILKWATDKGNIDTSMVNASTVDYGILVNDITGANPHLMPLNGPKLTDCEIAAVKNWLWHYYSN